MNKFKTGQKVKIIRTEKIGKITEIDNDDYSKCGWSNRCYEVSVKNGYEYWVTVHDIELIKEILDEKEKEYLNNIIKPFRNRVTYIEKRKWQDSEYIKIGIKNDVNIDLPNFEKGKMYQGMESDKNYTLSELGLED